MVISRLLSIQVGLPKLIGVEGAPDPMDRPWTSAFFKEPVPGPVRIGTFGIEGDGVADRVNHGGRDKAVLAYAAGHYPDWRAELGLPEMPFGAFGENLTIDGQDGGRRPASATPSRSARPSSRSRSRGNPAGSSPAAGTSRTCPASVIANGRGGWYFRVLDAGLDRAGAWRSSSRSGPSPNGRWRTANLVMHHRKRRPRGQRRPRRLPVALRRLARRAFSRGPRPSHPPETRDPPCRSSRPRA